MEAAPRSPEPNGDEPGSAVLEFRSRSSIAEFALTAAATADAADKYACRQPILLEQ